MVSSTATSFGASKVFDVESDKIEMSVLDRDDSWNLSVLFDSAMRACVIDGVVSTTNEQKKAEGEMARAQDEIAFDRKNLLAILEAIPSAVVLIEASTGRFSYMNRRAMDLYGIDYVGIDLDVHAKKVHALKPNGTPYRLEEMPVSNTLKSGKEVHNEEMTIERADAVRLSVLVNSAPLFDAKGIVTAAIVVFEDITERKRAEEAVKESEEKYRALFESSSDCILVWDRQYNYLYANQAAIDHVGTTRDKVIGKNIIDGLGHIPDFMHLWMERVDRAFATGEPFRVEDTVLVGDRLVHSESQVSPIRDAAGQVFAAGVVYRDITERKRAEQALRASETRFKLLSETAAVSC